jgi:hypothetical protein
MCTLNVTASIRLRSACESLRKVRCRCRGRRVLQEDGGEVVLCDKQQYLVREEML